MIKQAKMSWEDRHPIRKRSGQVNSGDRLVVFLYFLVRDVTHAGKIEGIMREIEGIVGDDPRYSEDRFQFCNGWLAQWCKDVADRLVPGRKGRAEKVYSALFHRFEDEGEIRVVDGRGRYWEVDMRSGHAERVMDKDGNAMGIYNSAIEMCIQQLKRHGANPISIETIESALNALRGK